jgi:hypothetical protein
VFPWADLKAYADYSQEFLEWVLAQKKAGKNVDELAAEYRYPAKYANYGRPRPEFLKLTIRAIYDTPGLD